MPVRASPRTGRLKPMLRVPPPPRDPNLNGGTPSPGPAKGKEKVKGPERRVLPARVRRAAGGGAEGIRDIEEMVVDWLERWGDIDPAPPESVVVRVTTAPLKGTYAVEDNSMQAGPSTAPMNAEHAVTPTGATSTPGPSAPALTTVLSTLAPGLVPGSALAGEGSHVSSALNTPVPGVKRIETPAWIMVKAGEDDAEEARQEMVAGPNRSPSKRLRHGVVGLEVSLRFLNLIRPADLQIEDTSDAYYEAQHRRFEAFEKRQRIREREQLQFNRYKMKARVDLLRNLPQTQWVSMVAAILAREGDETWQRGRRKLTTMGNDWLRRHLIKEGLEVLRRYDELLPKEGQKEKEKEKEKALKGLAASPASSPPPPSTPKPVIKLRLFSSAQREAAAREAAAKEAARKKAEEERQRQRSRSSSLSSLSDCDPSSPASVAATPTPVLSEPSAHSPASVPSPVPLRLKLQRPKSGSLQTTLKWGKPTPSPTKPPPPAKPAPALAPLAPALRAPRSSTGSASTEASSPRKTRRLSSDSADVTGRRRSLRSQPSKQNALGLVEDDEADMAGVEAEVLKL
ncbi:hypothetical protein A1Q1_02847 [Trichosporon asahii var. asahii CBS 2479]|uniref:Something about silencing protein 4 domain-containing protein n=1 Tax=Trichosporon asahii var. asahii (strain ATCC 90039 / CBS 2479 / JCM 2466 / KCTC 7840 / NBRC 103889/ NCYC 2677 / UAMH 7654) TaxID=1186058 RepID=J5QMM8_TRIAS|nr:hypothetical protein A1Q1_02847 [Trichosporon asahii var. asahii CBS 2479]EJT48143.1 hypothetical protein A1Q1_02847 [Trichosporon asahii var. asahii CBS 2479]